jgi:hypothetical protein
MLDRSRPALRRLPRPLLAALAASALALGPLACGGSNSGPPATATAPVSATAPRPHRDYSTHNNDRDNDGDNNNDDAGVLDYGHAADAADAHSSATLVKAYFAAAAAEDGTAGCALLAPFIAQAMPEQEGRTRELRGNTCAVVLTKLFRVLHREFALKEGSLRVMSVRVQGDKALTIVDFPAIPEVRELNERRSGSGWRLLELRDGNLE